MAPAHLRPVLKELARLYPETRCFLKYRTPFQLLAAVQLSAQCTDEQVNRVTPLLFSRFPDAPSLAEAPLREVEALIRPTGFFRNKARNLVGCAKDLLERHGGRVPRTLEELTALPGVGRKTANVVIGELTGKSEGVVVDTHVKRVAKRLGFTRHTDPAKIERDLMEILPEDEWVAFPHRLIQHGRKVCNARAPKCGVCTVAKWCPSRFRDAARR